MLLRLGYHKKRISGIDIILSCNTSTSHGRIHRTEIPHCHLLGHCSPYLRSEHIIVASLFSLFLLGGFGYGTRGLDEGCSTGLHIPCLDSSVPLIHCFPFVCPRDSADFLWGGICCFVCTCTGAYCTPRWSRSCGHHGIGLLYTVFTVTYKSKYVQDIGNHTHISLPYS
jgi:hypothetical protein